VITGRRTWVIPTEILRTDKEIMKDIEIILEATSEEEEDQLVEAVQREKAEVFE
tara:strand:- start:389 stop:550 length:162 start_codon:yes stop_codon:yes gene_type:complete